MTVIGGKELGTVLKSYGLNGDWRIERLRSVFVISNGSTDLVLKPLRIGSIKTNLITRFIENNQQCQLLPALVKTADNNNYCWYQGNRYLLTGKIAGREADYLNDADLQAAIRAMSLFHCETCLNNQVDQGQWSLIKYDPVRSWKQYFNEMNNCKKRAVKQGDAFSKWYLQEWSFYAACACQSIQDYQQAAKDPELVFCYHDWAYHNVIIDQCGLGKLIDFDYLIIDRSVHDKSNLIARYLRLYDWSLQAFGKIIDCFDRFYPWHRGELELLRIYLSFPYDFWILGRQYYIEKQHWSLKYYREQWDRKVVNGKKIQRVLRMLEKLV
ncbi:MAG TPA: hypothetical protein PLZ08_03420 [Bacillota bacterium]|nr:hypothetical protein [Bacillota bacterium]HOL08529.1 hypothetical protein [Bacillota bacterium]HPO96990.1 hypothetical protein [Bacillota bacterium]